MNSLLALVWIAPGYVVQAWLFETGRALGGLGYQVTMIGVSALWWTLVALGVVGAVRYFRRRFAQTAQPPSPPL
jgi:hypothetical protein